MWRPIAAVFDCRKVIGNRRIEKESQFMPAAELTTEEFAALVEERVQAAFGMSVAEFEKALEEGRLDPDAPHVATLAILVGA